MIGQSIPSHITRYFKGAVPASEDYWLISGLFLRLLALIYLVAFVSIGIQIVGLAGSEGILPITDKLQRIASESGIGRFWEMPALFWFDSSDMALQGVALAGCLFAVLLFFNILQRFSLILLFVLYLSLFHAGQIFMNFQWDYLLLEAGFLAIFLPAGSRTVIWLFRWLLFRFRFLSGLAKLLSQDPTWAGLTTLSYYFEVQPLPHWLSWHAHQLPEWSLKFGTGSALFIELLVPFMMFLPRGPRFFAAWATILMQVLILLSSNHNFSNLLTIILCLFLFDDRAVKSVVPARAVGWLTRRQAARLSRRPVQTILISALGVFIVFVSSVQMWEMISGQRSPEPVASVIREVKPFRLTSNYHVFPTMKTERVEIVVEGSNDGVNWQDYEFRYKPGALDRKPEIVVPHQPRLDWMMWFVPVGPPFLPWYERFLNRLLENSPAVTGLLESSPFPDGPPRFVRSSAYLYRFASAETRAATGEWWQRQYLGPFYPLPSLERQAPDK